MRHDYTKLDAEILAELSTTTPKLSWRLWNVSRIKLASLAIAAAVNVNRGYWQKMPEQAPLDRRLQALRKAGLIRYQSKPEGWVRTNSSPAGRTSKTP